MKDEARKLINTFYQPLGGLLCNVNSDTMWEYAKERALEVCLMMLKELSSSNDIRWDYWTQIKVEIKKL